MATQATLEKVAKIYELLTKSPVSEDHLCKIFNKDKRTIARYIKILKDDGINIRLNNKIYSITDLKKDENDVVFSLVKNFTQNQGYKIYQKSKGLFKDINKEYKNAFFIQPKNENLDSSDLEFFKSLAATIENKELVNFTYNDYKFRVKPLKIANFDGFWYLLCLDANKDDKFKKFHLKSIKNLTILNERFTNTKDIEAKLKNANSIWFDIDSQGFIVELLVDNSILKFLERIPLKTQAIIRKQDESEVHLKVSNYYEIVPFILQFIPFIKVIAPSDLNEYLKNLLSEYLKSI
ncbi:WYL domain-containing transcriptional regulator [Campylobacter ureolyticus]|uniref:WYL domain-containing transcriptional regulator n=1 Tax=Campylobacter ureolyticus TaxID=827 RepID=A0A9Q4PS43_9BACT|nr:WYL domain-containing transcriptional regulator [Campylobacter ureolyticus]MCZ6159818.1 WYL domain-containing transcriptional regulator [Campylobacter ureolyticus]MCZ6163149.1 WYL domain-containing transcriptional regulator [Campylobacter ureolyticus]MCZ6165000.1 WYL domain-containing transcriptional regulator [Campylobacter ureolyticus]MCZ6167881.1 WYL domain-containing transcriptional regulator [Campylobacter ureolyticus]MCZ6186301.1 WYL domain-containing transcriptional regulator [Campyl